MWSKEEGEQHTERGSTEEKHEEGGHFEEAIGTGLLVVSR